MLEPMEHERRLHLYRQGLNDREIAERLYLTPEAITSWRRASKLPAHNQHRKVTPEMEAEMRRLHREGANDMQIARALGMPKPTGAAGWRIFRGFGGRMSSNGGQRFTAPARGI